MTRQTTIEHTDHGEEEAQMVEDLYAALQPVVADAGLELVDVEMKSGVLQVTVDREGGVDLEALTDANRAVSTVLDELDPIPGRYSIEVSSPGVERTLRTPEHFAKAVGETVSVKTRPQVPGERRLRGHPGRFGRRRLHPGRGRRCRPDPPAVSTRTSTGHGRSSCGARRSTPARQGLGRRSRAAKTQPTKQTQKRKQVVTP